MVPSEPIWNDISENGTADNILKSSWLNGAFKRYVWMLEHIDAICNDMLKVETAEKKC